MSEQPRPRLVPPAWLLFTLVLQAALWAFLPGPQLLGPPWHVIGVALFALGAVGVIWTARLFRLHDTPIRPGKVSETLIVTGPYRWSRNPIYLSMILSMLGSALWFGVLTPFLPVIGFFWILQSQFVAMEEQMLLDRFGDEYEKYQRRVRRWL